MMMMMMMMVQAVLMARGDSCLSGGRLSPCQC
jgi:hypothetical protein